MMVILELTTRHGPALIWAGDIMAVLPTSELIESASEVALRGERSVYVKETVAEVKELISTALGIQS